MRRSSPRTAHALCWALTALSASPGASTVIFEDGFESNTVLAWAVAALEVTEVNPVIATGTISGFKDLVELVVVAGGDLGGASVWVDFGQVLTFPTLTVASGDIVVLHLNGTFGANESTGKSECVHADCYANAWDFSFSMGSLGLPNGNHTVMLVDKYNHITDMVPFSAGSGGDVPSFPAGLQFIQSSGFWLPINCGGSPCTYATTPDANDVSASFASAGDTAEEASLQRVAGGHGDVATEWTVAASSWGEAND